MSGELAAQPGGVLVKGGANAAHRTVHLVADVEGGVDVSEGEMGLRPCG